MSSAATPQKTGLPEVRRLGHLPQLDGLRGLAITSVIVYHYDEDHFANRFFRGGFLGVDLFFVLSGFLITCLLLQEAGNGHGIRLGRFYSRRMRRLLPAAWSMVIPVTVLLLVLGRRVTTGVLVTGLTSLGYVTNWSTLLPGDHPFELGHMWSLAVEEQFYLFWPLALLGCLRWRMGPATMAKSTAAVLLTVTLARSALALAGEHWQVEYLATPLHCDGLLFGALAGQAYAFGRLAPWAALGRRLRAPLVIAMTAELFVMGQFGHAAYLFGISIFVLMATLLLAGLIEGPPGRLYGFLTSPALQWLGLRSYSLYLWSLPAEYLLDRITLLDRGSPLSITTFLATAGLLAEGSYRLIENRFRDRTRSPGTSVGVVASEGST